MLSTDVSALFAQFLTTLNEGDPAFVQQLVNTRFPITNQDIDVIVPAEGLPDICEAGLLGVLNGFLDSIEQPRIAVTVEDDGSFSRFKPLRPTFRTITIGQTTVEVDASMPEVEIEVLKGWLAGLVGDTIDMVISNYYLRVVKLPPGADFIAVCAPGVPEAELLTLQGHVNEAMNDPKYTIATNYELFFTSRVGA